MKWFPVFCYLGVAAWQVGTNFEALFPTNAAQRQALRDCFAGNHQFDPLDAAARDACYREVLVPPKIIAAGALQGPRIRSGN